MQEAQATFRRAVRALNTLVEELEDRNTDSASEATRIIRDLKQALGPALSERERIETEVRKEAGVANAYAIDFDAARFEIGRRLDRLRAARDQARLPEEPQS